MIDIDYTPSPEVVVRGVECMQKYHIPIPTILAINDAVVRAIDEAIRKTPISEENIILAAGFNAGMNILWEKGYRPTENGITTYVTALTHDYTTIATQKKAPQNITPTKN